MSHYVKTMIVLYSIDYTKLLREKSGPFEDNLYIFGIIEKYGSVIGKTMLNDIESVQESIRFAGCSVCLRLFEEGILQKINQNLIDKR